MLHLVFLAFVAAGVTYFGARLTKRDGEFAAARHVGSCQPADLRTVHIERNAARHRFRVLFLQAGNRAVVACIRADVARFDT
jgi:hypothetical protein